jgi:hypothetical protein
MSVRLEFLQHRVAFYDTGRQRFVIFGMLLGMRLNCHKTGLLLVQGLINC